MKQPSFALITGLLALAVLPAQTPPAAPPQAGAAKLRVLIVSGDDVPAHDWKQTTPVLREILEATGRFDVRVAEEPGILASPALDNYDVVVLNFRDAQGRDPGEEARQKLQRFVAGGKGLVAVHFAVNAFREWKEYRDLVGRVWVPKASGHGPRGTFAVKIAQKDHPLTAGLSDFEADDELYAGLAGEKEINVLLTAYSDFTKKVEPIAWTLPFEKGRVFAFVLGHDVRARRNPAFTALFARGTQWAAESKGAAAKDASAPGEPARATK